VPPTSASQLKGGRNHISVLYLSPQTDLGTIIGLDKPVSGTAWWTADATTKIFAVTGNVAVTDDAYAAGWNGSTNVPTKNAIYDKLEAFAFSGSYTPTLTNTLNASASSIDAPWRYVRVANTVIVSGMILIDPTAALNTTQVDATLPISTTLPAPQYAQLGGAAFCTNVLQGLAITGLANKARFEGTPADAANKAYGFVFSYPVL
jgi:hypothetical protein